MPAVLHDSVDLLAGLLGAVQAIASHEFINDFCVIEALEGHLPQGVDLPHQDPYGQHHLITTKSTIPNSPI